MPSSFACTRSRKIRESFHEDAYPRIPPRSRPLSWRLWNPLLSTCNLLRGEVVSYLQRRRRRSLPRGKRGYPALSRSSHRDLSNPLWRHSVSCRLRTPRTRESGTNLRWSYPMKSASSKAPTLTREASTIFTR
ncbi:unnamed protein product [Ectocarpus sp. 12 AP-2014]